ncbi:MAG: 2-oxoacid:acceptor oxidoreductase family protein [Planctomycetota bacterium]|nr:2-oxoacid:acceptor oxidoreductase family protein [Planctomycetota bacterium]
MQAHTPRRTGSATGAASESTALMEVRLAGRGGQGVVTAGELLGEAVLKSGRHAQSLPTFGPERRGALAQCTLRVADAPIELKCSSASPSALVCLDPTIWRHAPVTLGLQDRAQLIFNTSAEPADVEADLRSGEFASKLAIEHVEVHTLDATGIALEALGRPISNTAMLGAVAAVTGVVDLAAIEEVLRGRFGPAGDANVAAARAGYEAVGGGAS